MQNMTYPYSNTDLLENPERYQFTKFMGEKFLESYFYSRKIILNDIGGKIDKKMNFSEIIDNLTNINNLENNEYNLENNEYNLEKLLLKILSNNQNRKEKLNEIIDIFLKKYEIKKKLVMQYDNDFHEKDSNYKNLRNYILLDLLCVIRFNETKNLKFLNTILKINDMLVTQISLWNNKNDLCVFQWLLENEIRIILELCKLKGVKI